MKKIELSSHCKPFPLKLLVYSFSCLLALGPLPVAAQSASDYVSIPPLISTESSGDKPNVLFILDNSNSMDEAPSGQAVGSASSGSKSEIARNAIETIITNFRSTARVGLMAYQQSGVGLMQLHDSQYDVSYDPANYDSTFTGDRASLTKRNRVAFPGDPDRYIYYNVALPFYAGGAFGNRFCYSTTADFDNGSENPSSGPWDSYGCYAQKTGTSDNFSGFSSLIFNSGFRPTDSDYAQNILDFGTNLTWQHIGPTWFSNSSPGGGYLHVEVADVESDTQYDALFDKLDTSQFSSWTDTPLRNAGLTPIEGSLRDALRYFQGTLPSSQSVTSGIPSSPPANSCNQNDVVILVTDGLPSTDASGGSITDTATAINNAATRAAALAAQGIETYVIGFALPTGVDASLLDTIANAGDTNSSDGLRGTYLASDSAALLASLESIFLSFGSRESSSSSAAVLANNSRGEGALFQAIYSPEKEDSLNNTVTWVGNLFGLFVDEEGFVREDTNGNAQLDGYDTDRVVEYFFDAGSPFTQSDDVVRANLYVGSGASTPPDIGTDTPVATVEADALSTIWNARDPLAALSDVSTQRTYTDTADNGRYILTSVDGQNAMSFIQTTDAEIAALVAQQTTAQATLDTAQADLNVAQAQYDAAVGAVTLLESQMNTELAELTAAQNDVATAQTNLTNANTARANAEATLAAEIATFEAYSLDFQNNETTRINNLNTAFSDFETLITATFAADPDTSFDTLINAVIARGGDTSDPGVIAALGALNSAESDYVNATNSLIAVDDYFNNQNASPIIPDLNALQSDLVAMGTMSDSDRTYAETLINNFNANFLGIANAGNTYSIASAALSAARWNYYDALIATGVNPNPAAIAGPRSDFMDDEVDFNAELLDAASFYGGDFNSAAGTYIDGPTNLVGQSEVVADAVTDVATAIAAVGTAQTALTAAQDAETLAQDEYDQSVLAYAAGQNDVVPFEDAYNERLADYNTALAAYNVVTQTINNSNALLNYLDVPTVEQAYNTISFVRGEEGISGFRSRTIDIDGDNSTEVWRLGDIVHSSPALVGAPADRYDTLHFDNTYAQFRQQYQNRRQVIYVGANDGMLHAFNGGFWNLSSRAFTTNNNFAGGGAVEHALGAELWSYVPRAALPHLQWLTDPNYAHTYYVDGDPVAFDANIFTPDATHPNGWGTVLMVGMRFGGSPADIDADADGSDDTTVRSSYMLFDVTDPEQAPTLIAEISDPGLGFTTSKPKVIKRRVAGEDFSSPTTNEWYVVFGSGPTELDDGASTQTSGLYVYDLMANAFLTGFNPLALTSNSFVGDIAVFDDDSDYVDDTAYFGVNSGSPSAGSSGVVMRARLDQPAGSAVSVVYDAGEPILSEPTVTRDQAGRRWVAFGTGRLFMAEDNVTTDAQHFFGVMEPVNSSGDLTWGTVSSSDIENVTSISVLDTGEVTDGGTVTIAGETVESFDELINVIREERGGWQRDFDVTGNPSERNISRSALASNVLFFTSYTPSTNTCFPEGTSRLWGLDVRTGTAPYFEVFAPDDDPLTAEGDVADAYVSLGQGLASGPVVLRNSGGTTISTTLSTTELNFTDVQVGVYRTGRQSWRQIYLD